MTPDSLRELRCEGADRDGVERSPTRRSGAWARLGCAYPRPCDGRLVQLRLQDRWARLGFERGFALRYETLRAADAAAEAVAATAAHIFLCGADLGLPLDVVELVAASAAWVVGVRESRPVTRSTLAPKGGGKRRL